MGKCGCSNTSIEVNTPPELIPGQPSSVPCTTPCTPTPSACPTTCVPQGVPMSSCNPCGPQPYYASSPLCPENNKQVVTVMKRSSVLKSLSAFAMPACGASLRVVFDNVCDVPIGAWIWAQGIGFLEILTFNPYTGEIEVRNPCPEGCDQAPAGTPIPACTIFVVTAPLCVPAINSGLDCVRLTADFTAPPVVPAIGSCILISVSSVTGLVVGKNVAITTGIYRIDAINSATSITICNDGAGLPPGTPVIAQDGAGNFIVCVILIDTNPCTFPDILEGKPLACLNGIAQPLVGTESGQILVYDDTSGNSSFKTLGIPVLDCTTLITCLTLDPLLPPGTSYIVEVVSTAAYSVTQLVLILGRVFEITSIVNGTQMYIKPLPDPVVIETFPAGSQLCSADCCTQLQTQLDNIVDNEGGTAASGAVGLDITLIGTDVNANTTPLIFPQNTSLTNIMQGMVIVNAAAQVIVDTLGVWRYSVELDIDGAGFTFSVSHQYGTFPGLMGMPWILPVVIQFTVPVNTTRSIRARHRIETLVGAGGASTWVNGSVGLQFFGTAI